MTTVFNSGRTQRGAALLLLVAVIGLLSLSLLLSALNAAPWKAERHRVTNDTLAMAKEALIARAVADENRPGSLPCPDINNDGIAELFTGSQCPRYVGRLPWRTLQLPDIRDAGGERLWYVLSRTHRDHPSAEPINSNTVGEITVNGTAPAPQLLAALIAPGRALLRSGSADVQVRDCPTNCNAPVNYLDAADGFDNAVWAVSGGAVHLVSAQESDTFNDRVLAIRSDDIMPLVEKRAGREISLAMRARYEGWKEMTGRAFYPWAAPFSDPDNPGLGASDTHHGHLPETTTPLAWTSVSTNLGSCSGVGSATLTCTANVGLGLLAISGSLEGIATRFVEPPTAPLVSGLPVWESFTWTVNSAAQRLDFQYSALLGLVTVTVQAPVLASWAPPTSAWLVNNHWNRVATYAVSAGYSIRGPGNCDASSPCISLGGPADKEAVVMMTGRPLALLGQGRPPAAVTVADYLEAANAVPLAPLHASDLGLERNLPTAAFNDQPVAVRP